MRHCLYLLRNEALIYLQYTVFHDDHIAKLIACCSCTFITKNVWSIVNNIDNFAGMNWCRFIVDQLLPYANKWKGTRLEQKYSVWLHNCDFGYNRCTLVCFISTQQLIIVVCSSQPCLISKILNFVLIGLEQMIRVGMTNNIAHILVTDSNQKKYCHWWIKLQMIYQSSHALWLQRRFL